MKSAFPIMAMVFVCGCNTFGDIDTAAPEDETGELWNQCSEPHGGVERVKSASVTPTKAASGFSMAFDGDQPRIAFVPNNPGLDTVEVRAIQVRDTASIESGFTVAPGVEVREVELHADAQGLGTLISLASGNYTAIQFVSEFSDVMTDGIVGTGSDGVAFVQGQNPITGREDQATRWVYLEGSSIASTGDVDPLRESREVTNSTVQFDASTVVSSYGSYLAMQQGGGVWYLKPRSGEAAEQFRIENVASRPGWVYLGRFNEKERYVLASRIGTAFDLQYVDIGSDGGAAVTVFEDNALKADEIRLVPIPSGIVMIGINPTGVSWRVYRVTSTGNLIVSRIGDQTLSIEDGDPEFLDADATFIPDLKCAGTLIIGSRTQDGSLRLNAWTSSTFYGR
ncbi:MAG: hypothetical protein R3E66_02000 [bacterium]